MSNTEEYNVNFFKPMSDHARTNKKLIATLAIIWFCAVFGFQALLIILNEPTPEPAFSTFQTVYPEIVNNQETSLETKQQFSRTLLSVLGKNIAVADDHKSILKQALSSTVVSMLPDSVSQMIQSGANAEFIDAAKNSIGLAEEGFDKIMIDLLPFSLVKVESAQMSSDVKEALPGIMELYLVHNQNALTDFNFLGFPFHYWYTSQFLLILFVVLCLIYAVIIDRTSKKFNFVEES
jgi:putative solute:sodium symporter small subunit